MAYKAYVTSAATSSSGLGLDVHVPFFDITNSVLYDDAFVSLVFGTDIVNYTVSEFQSATQAKVLAYAVTNGYSITAADIVWPEAGGNGIPKVFSSAARSLNSAFQVSATRDSSVSYAIDVATTISLTSGQVGTVVLEYADNSGMTTNVVTVNSTVSGNTGTLTIGLNLTQTATAAIGGLIPAGKYARLRTVNTTGTPTFTYRNGQEVLL